MSSQVPEMVIRNAETTQGDDSLSSAAPAPADQLRSRAGNTVFKSGPLFISSKGIGWTSWKKRWFILTRTSLVFFRSDPSVLPQKGSEVNLTLGGIDLNNSGSVVVREDKKLLTVLFPDGRDGRAFTLKAETTEDLNEWKTALENALAQAPSAAIVVGQNAIFQNDLAETTDGPPEQIVGKEKQPVKSLVVGRPILLALEDVDGTPSFLEKALTFIEQHGVKVEGILRQAADVDDVERRVREYEQGKTEFSPEEDAHVIADCVKHVLRELPSSPVPASCCNALLQACRTERGGRIKAMRAAISETFPEPNRRLLQRILRMMQVVASHKSENRMSSSAVAACMAPLLLRPLLAGDLELDHDFNVGGDGSVQLLQAAAAANHAQTIVITLLEEHEKIFGDGILQDESISPELGSETDECGSDDYEPTEEEENLEDDEYIDSVHDSDVNSEDDPEGTLSGSVSESSGGGDDQYQDEVSEGFDSDYESSEVSEHFADDHKITCDYQTSISHHDNLDRNGSLEPQVDSTSEVIDESHGSPESVTASTNLAAQSVPASMNLALRSPASTNLAPQSYRDSSNSAPGCVPASTNIAPQCTPASSNSAPQNIPISTNLAPQSTPASTNVASQSVPTLTNFATRSIPLSTNLASQSTQALANGASQNLPAPTNSATQCVLAPINLAPNSVVTSTGLAHKTNVQSLSSSNTKMTTPSVKRPTVWGRTSARKNLSMESIDFAIEAEAAIERLEVTRTNLQNKIAKEVKENEVLHSSLETRKKALHVHRLALEKDVENLKEQLQKEREIKVAMEARYNLPLGCLPASSALDDETKAELEEISQAEEDISNLTKKLAKLHMQLNQQRSENHLFFSDQQNLPQKNGSNQEIKNDEQEDLEDTIANSHAKSTRSEDSSRVKKSQEKFLLRTQPDEKQQMDLTNIECNKPAVTTVTASSVEPAIVASSPSSFPKKSSTNSEGTITTSYALSKLTTRLNFLKERRSQIVNELQSIDNSKVPSEGQLARAPASSTSG